MNVITFVLLTLFAVIALAISYQAFTQGANYQSKAAEEEKIVKQWEFTGGTEGWFTNPEASLSQSAGQLIWTPNQSANQKIITGKAFVSWIRNDALGKTKLRRGNKYVKLSMNVKAPLLQSCTGLVTIQKNISQKNISVTPTCTPRTPQQFTMTVMYNLPSPDKWEWKLQAIQGVADGQIKEYAVLLPDIGEITVDKIIVVLDGGISGEAGASIAVDWIRLTDMKPIVPTPTPRPTPTSVCKTGLMTVSFDTSCGSNLYRYATFTCYDGNTGRTGGPTSCKSTDLWTTYARDACSGRSSCPIPSSYPTYAPVPSSYATPYPTSVQAVCTQDAKRCPDGSYVGRIPPKCEFAPCPQ